MGFTVGQRVWSILYGWGTVVSINPNETYTIEVNFDTMNPHDKNSFLLDGRAWRNHELPSLFHKEQTFDYGKPEWQPKPGELCWVWNGGWGVPNVRIISEIDDGLYIAHVPASDIKMEYTYCAPFNNGQLPDEFKHLLEGGNHEG